MATATLSSLPTFRGPGRNGPAPSLVMAGLSCLLLEASRAETSLPHLFARERAVGEDEACLYVFSLQIGILGQYRLYGVAGGEHSQDMLHCDPHFPNGRLAAEDVRPNCDSGQELGAFHVGPSFGLGGWPVGHTGRDSSAAEAES